MIVLGTKTGDVFVPVDVAESSAFEITAGRVTALSLAAAVGGVTTALEGEALNGVVVEAMNGTDVLFASSGTRVQASPFGAPVTYPIAALAGASEIHGLSVGTFLGNPSVYVNTDTGVYTAYQGPLDGGIQLSTSLASAMTDAGISDVVDTGGFLIDPDGTPLNGDETEVFYYQRLGGLGGATFVAANGESPNSAAADDWNDSGADLTDYIEPDQRPVRAMATNGESRAYIAGVFGTFGVTDTFFEDDFDAGVIISGENADGFIFLGVAYPGTDRPLRIVQLGYYDGAVFVGTPRGAFAIVENKIPPAAKNDGLVPSDFVLPITFTRDQPVFGMSANDGYLAIMTAQGLLVYDVSNLPNLSPIYRKPFRAVTLGAPADMFVVDESGVPTVYIAGSDGLTRIVE